VEFSAKGVPQGLLHPVLIEQGVKGLESAGATTDRPFRATGTGLCERYERHVYQSSRKPPFRFDEGKIEEGQIRGKGMAAKRHKKRKEFIHRWAQIGSGAGASRADAGDVTASGEKVNPLRRGRTRSQPGFVRSGLRRGEEGFFLQGRRKQTSLRR
jgi:hypothetical protein